MPCATIIRTKKKNAVLTPASQPRGQSLTEPPAASGTGAVSCRRARGQSVPSALIFLEVSVISKKALINEEIKAKEVRVVSADGAQIGVLSIEKALRMAFEAGLDLVEIAPEGKPPVCKIMDFGRYRFEREKREKEIRKNQQTTELKELQLTCNIGQHDLQTKLNHATRFLTAGNKVKVIVKFRGREMAHTERGRDLLDRFAAGVEELGTVEKVPLLDGRNMIMVLAPKKNTTTPKGKEKNGKNQDA